MSAGDATAPESGTGQALGRARVTIGLCFLAALVEGIDLQSAGIAGPGVAQEFAFTPGQLGFILSGSYFGLICGASLGGRLADAFGRKYVLAGSLATYGVFALATTVTPDFLSMVSARLLTGLGLGGALANLVALTAEAAGPAFSNRAVALMYSGLPLGSIVSSGTGVGIEFSQWRIIFYTAGIVPLIVAPLLAFFLPESDLFLRKRAARAAEAIRARRAVRRESIWRVLFGEGRAITTLLLWVAIFCPHGALSLLLSWLPALLAAKGLGHAEASIVQVSLNVGSAIGILGFGFALGGAGRVGTMAAFGGAILATLALANASGLPMLMAGTMASGLFLSCCTYSAVNASPRYYRTLIRGTGVGGAIALSRLGSATGALAPGQLLVLGTGPDTVLLAAIPVVLVATLAMAGLFRRRVAED